MNISTVIVVSIMILYNYKDIIWCRIQFILVADCEAKEMFSQKKCSENFLSYLVCHKNLEKSVNELISDTSDNLSNNYLETSLTGVFQEFYPQNERVFSTTV